MQMLRRIRLDRGLTQAQLADRVGVRQSTVAAWETGTKKPSMDHAMETARVLACTVEELYGKGA